MSSRISRGQSASRRFFEGEQDDAAAQALGLAHEFLAFDVGRNAKESEGLCIGGFGRCLGIVETIAMVPHFGDQPCLREQPLR